VTAVSVVLPVYDRVNELKRALRSLQVQAFRDFECIIVDDASTMNTAAAVAEFGDSRFRLVRRVTNGGPAAARKVGYGVAEGEFLLALDSDWELYPWALEQGVTSLRRTAEVDIVTALHMRQEDSRLFVRVRDGKRIVTPEEFRNQEPVADRVAMVRRNVVERWMSLPGEFFAMESGLWITAELHHASLAMDEPWVRYHTGAANRVSASGGSISGRDRACRDMSTFLHVRRDLIECGPCVSVDRLLEEGYFTLLRSHHPDAGLAAACLRSRGVSTYGAIARSVRRRVRRKLGKTPAVSWV